MVHFYHVAKKRPINQPFSHLLFELSISPVMLIYESCRSLLWGWHVLDQTVSQGHMLSKVPTHDKFDHALDIESILLGS